MANTSSSEEEQTPRLPAYRPSRFIDRLASAEVGSRLGRWPLVSLAIGIPLLVLAFPLARRLQASFPGASLPSVSAIAPTLSLPLEVNDRVERWMERYLTDQRPAFEGYLERKGLYGEMIREGLRARSMPEELIFLAAIESGFSPNAMSPVAATGMWQFMGPTARAYGLRIDEWVDERRDPVRATGAALDYLQTLYNRFGSWYLAAAAYNAGPSRVARILKLHAGEEAGDEALYWEIVEHLPRETREYVPKMLALVLLSQAAEGYGFRVQPAKAVRFDRVWVPGGTSLRTVAKSLDVPVARLRELNPHLIRRVTPPGQAFALRVPPGGSPAVVASLGGRWKTFKVDD